MPLRNNAKIVDTCSQRLAALKEHLPPKTEIDINGTPYKPSELIAVYQADLDTRAALVKSRAQVKVDLAARKSAADERSEVEPWLKNWVQGKFGESSTVAHEFGFSPRRVGVKSAKTKAEAVELAQATREARHTMGKKKKQEIKGSIAPPNPPAPSEAVDAGSSNGAPAPVVNGAAQHN